MSFGLTEDGFKIKRLADIKSEIEQRFKDSFGEGVDLSASSPMGQIIAIFSEREALVWELAQDVYNSQYPSTSEGKQLDNVVSLTGTTRDSAKFSSVEDGVAYGDEGTIVTDGTVISVSGDPTARFVVQGNYEINIAEGETFKAENIKLVAEESGEVLANAGTLTVIETPIAGLNSFTNLTDADLGSDEESDSELKIRRNQELQISGAATVEAIISELSARPLVEAVIVFQNNTSITDGDGRPPHSLDIVVQGDDEQEVANTIFLVVGAGIETIGEITKTVVDSQGFDQITKFSRPVSVSIWIEIDVTKDSNTYPESGDQQIIDALVEYGETLEIGQDIIVYGSNSISGVLNDIDGILDYVIRIGKTSTPTSDDNVDIGDREISDIDSSRITITS
jgi:uncharacterized phage protein gp47/JayE